MSIYISQNSDVRGSIVPEPIDRSSITLDGETKGRASPLRSNSISNMKSTIQEHPSVIKDSRIKKTRSSAILWRPASTSVLPPSHTLSSSTTSKEPPFSPTSSFRRMINKALSAGVEKRNIVVSTEPAYDYTPTPTNSPLKERHKNIPTLDNVCKAIDKSVEKCTSSDRLFDKSVVDADIIKYINYHGEPWLEAIFDAEITELCNTSAYLISLNREESTVEKIAKTQADILYSALICSIEKTLGYNADRPLPLQLSNVIFKMEKAASYKFPEEKDKTCVLVSFFLAFIVYRTIPKSIKPELVRAHVLLAQMLETHIKGLKEVPEKLHPMFAKFLC